MTQILPSRQLLYLLVVAATVVVCLQDHLQARSCRLNFVPNGNAAGNGCVTCHRNFGGDVRNPFGLMVEEIVETLADERGTFLFSCTLDDFWGPELATADADGDGRTNGEELGDPEGTWVVDDDDPPPTFEKITNPGRADDFPPPVTDEGFKRGDADGDGLFTVGDAIFTLSYQFLGNVQPSCVDALDFDDTGTIDVSDAIGSLGHQFLGQAPPPPPGKDACGEDPTPDAAGVDLGCEGYPAESC